MAACLTAGRTKPPCDTLISGGVKEIYMVDRSDVDTITVGVGGDVGIGVLVAAFMVFCDSFFLFTHHRFYFCFNNIS